MSHCVQPVTKSGLVGLEHASSAMHWPLKRTVPGAHTQAVESALNTKPARSSQRQAPSTSGADLKPLAASHATQTRGSLASQGKFGSGPLTQPGIADRQASMGTHCSRVDGQDVRLGLGDGPHRAGAVPPIQLGRPVRHACTGPPGHAPQQCQPQRRA